MIEPRWICFDCGNKYGTSFYGICTAHKGICGICNKKKTVTSGRKFRPYKNSIKSDKN